MLRTVTFYGPLAEKFGEKHEIAGDTTYMVFQGLACALGNEFKQFIKERSWHILKGKDKQTDTGEEEVHMKLGSNNELHVIQAVAGANSTVRAIVGVVLIVIGLVMAAYNIPGSDYVIMAGIGMLAGAVAEMLSPVPKPPDAASLEAADERASKLYNGAVNVMEQGGPIPIVYGRVRFASSQVISTGLTTERIP